MNILPADIQKKLKALRGKYPQIPVPVVEIAKDMGLKIYETNDFTDAESGSLKRENDGYVIYIDAKETPTRKRFTIAHEIGHFIMHKDLLHKAGDEFIDTLKQPVIQLQRSKKESVQTMREIAANQFAAALLMPENEFRKVFEQSTTVESVAQVFRVSPSAVTVRAKELLGQFII